MRLIDVDALPEPRNEAFDGDPQPLPMYDKETIDAAPTVSCAECRYSREGRPSKPQCAFCDCGTHFVRRQP